MYFSAETNIGKNSSRCLDSCKRLSMTWLGFSYGPSSSVSIGPTVEVCAEGDPDEACEWSSGREHKEG